VALAQSQDITDLAELSIIKAEAYPHYLHVMGILFVLNIAVMLIFGKLMPKKEALIEDKTNLIDVTPWKYAFVIGAFISILVISTYFIFS
jgi:SSS family solute:Na+ symporter